MADQETPQVERPEPQLSEPAAEARQPPASGTTQNIIAELRNSMAVVARSGAPRHVRIRTYGRYRAARVLVAVFAVVGWIVLLAGLLALFFAIGNLMSEDAGAVSFGSLRGFVASLDGIAVTQVLLSLATTWAGMFTILFALGIRARLDAADYARQALVLQKAIAEGEMAIDTRRLADMAAGQMTI